VRERKLAADPATDHSSTESDEKANLVVSRHGTWRSFEGVGLREGTM
jgi:hypothetical protein